MKKSYLRTAAAAGAALLAIGTFTACSSGGSTSDDSASSSAGAKIAFLMPDRASTRYEQQDHPLFEKEVKSLCADCSVLYQNADAQPSKQQQQADSVMAQGAKVLVLDPVDSTAAASIVQSAKSQGVTVITYDRPITDAKADFYISFDNEKIGHSIAQSLTEKLKKDGTTEGVLLVNGSPTDKAAGLIKKGAEQAVKESGIPILASFDTPDWDPQKAQDWVSGQITQFGSKISGIVASNDGTGGGAIAALKAAGVTPLPPVTGNDAEVAAVQRIVAGAQYNTISKPIKIVATAAAKAAVGFLKGDKPKPTTTLFDTPTQLFVPTVVTMENLDEVIIKSGIYTTAEICTADYAAACATAGIK